MNWEKVRSGDICSKIGNGATVYIENGTAFIRSQNVYNLFFYFYGLVHINNEEARKLQGVTIEQDDVLLNITGDSAAGICVVPF